MKPSPRLFLVSPSNWTLVQLTQRVVAKAVQDLLLLITDCPFPHLPIDHITTATCYV